MGQEKHMCMDWAALNISGMYIIKIWAENYIKKRKKVYFYSPQLS